MIRRPGSAKAKAKAKAKGAPKARVRSPRVRLRPAAALEVGAVSPEDVKEKAFKECREVCIAELPVRLWKKGELLVANKGTYYSGECKVAGSFKSIDFGENGIELRIACTGTTNEHLLKFLTGSDLREIRIHACDKDCIGDRHAPDLVHSEGIQKFDHSREATWEKNLEVEGRDELEALRKREVELEKEQRKDSRKEAKRTKKKKRKKEKEKEEVKESKKRRKKESGKKEESCQHSSKGSTGSSTSEEEKVGGCGQEECHGPLPWHWFRLEEPCPEAHPANGAEEAEEKEGFVFQQSIRGRVLGGGESSWCGHSRGHLQSENDSQGGARPASSHRSDQYGRSFDSPSRSLGPRRCQIAGACPTVCQADHGVTAYWRPSQGNANLGDRGGFALPRPLCRGDGCPGPETQVGGVDSTGVELVLLRETGSDPSDGAIDKDQSGGDSCTERTQSGSGGKGKLELQQWQRMEPLGPDQKRVRQERREQGEDFRRSERRREELRRRLDETGRCGRKAPGKEDLDKEIALKDAEENAKKVLLDAMRDLEEMVTLEGETREQPAILGKTEVTEGARDSWIGKGAATPGPLQDPGNLEKPVEGKNSIDELAAGSSALGIGQGLEREKKGVLAFAEGGGFGEVACWILSRMEGCFSRRCKTTPTGRIFPLPSSISALQVIFPDLVSPLFEILRLLVLALNSLNDEGLDASSKVSPFQRKVLDYLKDCAVRINSWDFNFSPATWEAFFKVKGIDYKGDEVQTAQFISWKSIEPALPQEVGTVKLEDVVERGCRDYVLDFEKYLVEPGEQTHCRPPRVMVAPEEWEGVCKGLLERGICVRIHEDEIHRIDGELLLNGLFGVSKHEFVGSTEIMRIIMNLIPLNGICRDLAGDIATLPSWAGMTPLHLMPDEQLVISSEDVRCFFYLFQVPEAWRKYLAFNRPLPASCSGPKAGNYYLASAVLPMGFKNSVSIAQHIHRNILKGALSRVGSVGAESEIRKDRPFPCGDSLHRIYLDNFDELKKVNRSLAGVIEGQVSPLALGLREEYMFLGVPRHPKKSVAQSSLAEVQGALVDGVSGLVVPKPEKLLKYCQLACLLLSEGRGNQKQLQVVGGGLVYLAMFRRPLLWGV